MSGSEGSNDTKGFTILLDDIEIDCGDAMKLATFYADLLGWNITRLDDDCVMVDSPGHPVHIVCQQDPDYTPPVWPEVAGAQQKSIHLDFTVSDMKKAVSYAVSLGAAVAEMQYNPKRWTTLIDPAGHPFCICQAE